MKAFIIRSILALGLLSLTVYSFYTGHWGWGIFLIFPLAIVIMTFIYNENIAFAINHMRTGNQDKAARAMNRITHPQLMPKRQHAYVLYMQAMLNIQSMPRPIAEGLIRKALGLGLKRGHDVAMAKMQLAGYSAQSGKRQDAIQLLAEAKKADTTNMLKDQIKMMEGQLKNAPSQNQMRMAQMQGGRKKMPRMR